MTATAKNFVDSAREIVQDLLVPELKAIRVEVASLRTEMELRDQRTLEAIRNLEVRMVESFKHLSEKTDLAINVREGLAALEARQEAKPN
jgi:hypothetical protein